MKILLSWLREFVDVPGTAEEIAATMSVRGFAVEGIESLPEFTEAVAADGSVARTRAASADAVIDFEVTANRPDCLSVSGMAREVATAYGLQVRRPVAGGSSLALTSLKSVDQGDIDIVIDNTEGCPRYVGAVADVKVGPSPEWMQARLRAAGVRPIGNIVDVTNYVLIELGQPMHAFDHARLGGGQIRIRSAQAGETLRTLDGQVRTLTTEMLVIADAERPVAVAGVMGGAESEVSADTTTIVLESAYFNPLSVRRTSKTLGLKTEASTRFERGADPRLPVTAMERACALLELIHAGAARGTLVDRYPLRREPTVLRLRRDRITGLLGTTVPDTDVRRILENLGFALRDAESPSTSLGTGGWDITVPTRRVDILREVDLIEEVARHNGFDRIPVSFPALTTAPPPMDPRITQARALRSIMTGAGFSEAMTFGFVSEPAAAPFAAEGDLVPIANPLSETFAVLRPSVLPGLVAAVAHNRRREQRDVRLFEIGARFSRARGERRVLACAWTGSVGGQHWSGGTRDVDYFDIQGLVDLVCQSLRLEAQLEPAHESWLVPGREAAVVANGRRVGLLGQLAPSLVEQQGLSASEPMYVAELDLDSVAGDEDLQVEPLPRHPSVTRDISILVADTLAAATVRDTVRGSAPEILARVSEFDRYQGKGVPDGQISLSLRLTFRAPDRTLTDGEVQQAVDAVLAALKERHSAIQR